MRGRGRLFLLLALVLLLGVVAVVLLLPQLTGGLVPATQVADAPEVVVPTPTPIPFVEIVVAVQELPRGIRIPAENAVELRRWPAEAAPFNALQSLDDVIGKIARTDIPRESPVLSTMLVDNLRELAERGRVGSDAAAVMPPGLVAVSIPMDRITGVAYAIREGDYVDVMMSMLFVDVDEEFQTLFPNKINLVGYDEEGNPTVGASIDGRQDVGIGGSPVIVGPSEIQRPRLVTQRTVQSAWVLRVGNFPVTGSYIGATPTPIPTPTPEAGEGEAEDRPAAAAPQQTSLIPDIVTLAVSPQDAVVLVWAVDAKLPITLALRSATDISQVPTQPVTLEYIMSNYNISAPNRLPYALEPALRSIRQLVAFEEIRLQESNTAPAPAQ
ncbi:MAG: Flp pilus assembly protein CpaB [Anaerolineae bacterium]|nr:Flp pilus assembly protein CpaB [Anaerolineae bacterium]